MIVALLASTPLAAALSPSQAPLHALQAAGLSLQGSSPFTFNSTATVGNPWVGLVPFAPKTAKREVLADGTFSFSEVTEAGTCATCQKFPRSMENVRQPVSIRRPLGCNLASWPLLPLLRY